MTSSELSRDATKYVRYLANDVIERMARRIPVNDDGRLMVELRQLAVEHNVEIAVIHRELRECLESELEPDDVDRLTRSSLQFLITKPMTAE